MAPLHCLIRTSSHIVAPFDLRRNMDLLYEPANMAFFNSVFPGNLGYSYDGMFLYVHLDKAPGRKIKTFAGVPVRFVTGGLAIWTSCGQLIPSPPQPVPPVGRRVSSRQGCIASTANDWDALFPKIVAHFDALCIEISEVIYWGVRVHIVLGNDDIDTTKLPCRAGDLTCFYFFESNMHRPTVVKACHRLLEPTLGLPGNRAYSHLQPGVRVSSDYCAPGVYFSSTLGVRVRDEDQVEYVTIAADRFPGMVGGDYVFHPLRTSGRAVGSFAGRVGSTDIGLMRLLGDELLLNEPCVEDGLQTEEAFLLRGLSACQRHDLIFMGTPETGYIDGVVMAKSRRRRPVINPDDPQGWVDCTWIFQDEPFDLPDGICGSAMFGQDGMVRSFFQYDFKHGPWKGWWVGTDASELLTRGFA